jgi:hypothetical protein
MIKKEISRLKRIYNDLDGKKKLMVEGLIIEAAYMRATLYELKKTIDTEGVIDEMPQGSYSILREHPAVKIYNTMIQRYTTIVKQLSDLLPKDTQIQKNDGFIDFVNEREEV